MMPWMKSSRESVNSLGVVDPLLVVVDAQAAPEDVHHRHDAEDPLGVVVGLGAPPELIEGRHGLMTGPRGGVVHPGETGRDVEPLGARQADGAGQIDRRQVEPGTLRIRRVSQPLQSQHVSAPSGRDVRQIDDHDTDLSMGLASRRSRRLAR